MFIWYVPGKCIFFAPTISIAATVATAARAAKVLAALAHLLTCDITLGILILIKAVQIHTSTLGAI